MRFLNLTVACVAALIFCGCDWGQPTFLSPRPDKQAVSAVTDLGKDRPQVWLADFAATKKDAESDDAEAQNNLGVMYKNGDGVPQDDVEAYVWESVAAAGGYADAVKDRDIIAGELTPEQLSQGQKRATELFEKISCGK